MDCSSTYCARRARWARERTGLAALLAAAFLSASTAAEAQAQTAAAAPRDSYLPGERTALGVGLGPTASQAPALPGGLTTPPGAPDAADDWTFTFRGFMSASLRASTGSRADPTADQHGITLHTLPRIVDAYGMFEGTNNPQGSWVDMTFDYGNKTVAAHVKVTTWKPSDGVDWTAIGSQNIVDEAYLTYQIVPPTEKLHFQWAVGAFRNIYGSLAQYSVGQYNAHIVGMPFGVGETLTAEYNIDETYQIHLEDGFMGRLAKAPAGTVPTLDNGVANQSIPSSWVHHAHVGLARQGDLPLVVGVHYLTNWAQDERDQVDDGKTYWINENHRPDPRMDVYGVDVKSMNAWFGNIALSASYADAKYAELLTGLNYFGAFTGEQLTKRFLGPQGGGTGKMVVVGAEYTLDWEKLLRHPEAFDGNGPDLTTSIFSDYAAVQSQDPDADGKTLYKFGAEATYRFAPWVAASFRADRVVPDSKDMKQSFYVISPKLIFKSNWLSHEQVTLAYSKWFLGDDTFAEFPSDYTRNQLDDQMWSLTFGMWF